MILVTGANGVVGYAIQQWFEPKACIRVSRSAENGDFIWDMENPETIKLPAVSQLIHCAPIWLLPAHLTTLYKAGVRHFTVFSSTSVLSKATSENTVEQQLVERLASAEQAISGFCAERDLSLTILRPSLIYGYGRDQNITHIAGFISRFGFAVVAGRAQGLRQPVHADDLARVCLQLSHNPQQGQQIYAVAGLDVITYRAMLKSIFIGLGKRPVIISIPVWSLRLVLRLASKLGRFDYTADMADRMQQNLMYDNQPAIDALGYKPSTFLDNPKRDLPDYVA